MRILTASEAQRIALPRGLPGRTRPEGEPRIDLGQVIAILSHGRWIIAAVTAVCLGLAALYLVTAPKIYVAQSQVLIDTRQQRPTETEQVVSNFEVTPSVVAGEVLTLRSNVLLGRVVDALDLTAEPAFMVEDPAIRATLTPEEQREYAIKLIQARLDVRQSGVSHVMLVTFGSEQPAMSARIANEVARQYIAEDIEMKRQATRAASAFLQERIDELAAEVERAEQALVDYRRQTLEAVGTDAPALTQLLGELNTELVAVSEDRAEAEIRLDTAEALLAAGGVDAVRNVISTPALDDLAATYATLAADQARLASTLGTDHPRYVSNDVQVQDILRSMNAEVSNQLESMRNEVAVARNRENSLTRRITEIRSQQSRLADAAVREGQLERSAAAARMVFEEFLARFTETNAQAELQLPQARIIGLATVPVVPAEPKKSLVAALALAMGLGLGTAWVLLRAAMTRKIGSVGELEHATGLPVLATLPYLGERAATWPMGQERFEAETIDRFTDRIKALRARLFQGSGATPLNVVMVTSAVPEEGKSTVSVALANSLRQLGRSVILVDADLRRSWTRHDLKLDKGGACLVDYLEGKEPPSAALIQYVPDFDVPVIAPMRTTRASADLLTSQQFARLMGFVADRYEYVVVDAPPAVSMADAQTIAAYCDAALLVVRNHNTRASLVTATVEQLAESGTTLAGTVLSHVRRKESRADELQSYYYG